MTIDNGLAAIIGVVVGGLITFLGSYVSLRYQREMADNADARSRHDAYSEYLQQLFNQLTDAFATVEGIHAHFDTEEEIKRDPVAKETYGRAIGRAESACLATMDPILRLMKDEMTPYIVTDYKNQNRTALHNAIDQFGKLIKSRYEVAP